MVSNNRYVRNETLAGIGEEGQRRLSAARVLVVGSGALGSIVAMHLAGNGVGHLLVADYDRVDLSNLQRQLSYTTTDVGHPKATTLAARCRAINPEIEVTALNERITADRLRELLPECDLVIEGSDNPATKAMVVRECVQRGAQHVIGGVDRWVGQVMAWRPGCPSWLDVFGELSDAEKAEFRVAPGLLGPLPGIVGSIMAAEAIKTIANPELTTLAGHLLIYDALTAQATRLVLG